MLSEQEGIIFLYDLPKESVTSVAIAEAIKAATKPSATEEGYRLTNPPQIQRDLFKPFYTARIKIPEGKEKAREICEKIKYFSIFGKPCRALNYDLELKGIN